MKKFTSNQTKIVVVTGFFIVLCTVSGLFGQLKPSFTASYDLFPSMKFADPDTTGGGAFLRDGEIRVATLNLRASYPLMFSQGRTIIINELAFQRFDLDYKNWPRDVTRIEHMYAIEYNFMLLHTLSDKWTLLAMLTPGLASDFEADLSFDDFTYQTVLVFIRKYSSNWSIGYGAAYTNTFGQPFPVPILAIEWNNGSNMKFSSILPVSSEFWYMPNPRLELGMSLKVLGNQYHGDPATHGVPVPYLRYSVGTFGPSVKFHLTKGLSLGIDSGITFLRRFQFYDKKDKVADYNMKNSGFVRINLQIGG